MIEQYLKDTLAYVRYVHNDTSKSDQAKYHALVSTLGHDLIGMINKDPFFRPRVSGYAKSARAVYDTERLGHS
jgi:hypothetical protein